MNMTPDMTPEELVDLLGKQVDVNLSMLFADIREGFVIGWRLRAAELEELTNVPAVYIIDMARDLNDLFVNGV
jgi:hypothetical protein